MLELQHYLQRHDSEGERDPEWAAARASLSAILESEGDFESAYAELRAFHVLARVEGYNGERWAMHRLVRDFGRARLRKREVMLHGMALSEWLKRPTLPLRPEIPHIVVTILDAARQQEYGDRFFAREHTNRWIGSFEGFGGLDARHFIEFIRDELNDPKALTLILAGLSDVNEDVRIQAIRLLEGIGPIPEVLSALQATLDDPDPEVRSRAGATLAKYGSVNTIEILTEAMRNPNPRARLTAVQALGLMGEKAHQALVQALTIQDECVQAEAALSLCEQGHSEGIPVLLVRLQDASDRQAERIIRSPGIARDDNTDNALDDLLPGGANRVRAVNALGKIGGGRACLALQGLLGDRSDEVRCAAVRALDTAGSEEGVRRAVDVLANRQVAYGGRYPGVVFQIAQKRDISLPFEAQLRLLKDEDWQVRMNCAIHLGKIKAFGAVESLIETIDDGDYDVRREVATALGLIGDARAVGALQRLSRQDSRDDVKAAAKTALAQIGES